MFDELIGFLRQWYRTDGPIPLHEPRFGPAEEHGVAGAVRSTFVSSVGPEVDRFEADLANRTGSRRAVCTVNGTAGLEVALRVAGVEPGQEVITQPLSFVATANAIAHLGATPVFIDVEAETLGLSPGALETWLDDSAERTDEGTCRNRLTGKRIAAVVPMHTFGHPARMNELLAVADRWNLPVVEDAAEALGSTRQGLAAGTFGLMGCLSFNGNKIITTGGGGAILTDAEDLADRARHLSTTARKKHAWLYEHDQVAWNYRMPNLNAALGCVQLTRLDEFLADKRQLAEAYGKLFAPIDGVEFISEPPGCRSNYWLNAILLPDRNARDELLRRTNRAGLATRPVWTLLCDLPMYRAAPAGPLDQARNLEERIVNLPSSARMP